ncbi:MAG: ABC transporter ATP-binding protein [Prevotellaceae bacterium]|jgi:lipopolysaccharide transport system ATP-binding protein|nr:ABC transporter ATP-binding protein [Prevotellaceae bacterium]
MSNIAIKFENISKQYRLGSVSTRTISHDLNRWWQTSILRREDPYLQIGETNDRAKKGTSEYVWALRNIDFEVKQGDVVGIIGKNGAGKSTLLKILSQVTTPTTGVIKVYGRIAALLEVGTGFHPEMTGRENIYMNGAILGMTKAEISRKLDEIVDFSGVERYLDTPVKRYSSGMTVRLGFAIAAHLDPEILVVDEVLAVGDAEFQKKAIGKMQDVSRGEGRTVLFVSHNMAAVENLCKTSILMEDGFIAYTGKVNDAISRYLKTNKTDGIYTAEKNSELYVKEIYICNEQAKYQEYFETWEKPCLAVEIYNNYSASLKNVVLEIELYNGLQNKLFSLPYELDKLERTPDCINKIFITFPDTFIGPGEYTFRIVIYRIGIELLDDVRNICSFRMKDNNDLQAYRFEALNRGSIITNAKVEILQ